MRGREMPGLGLGFFIAKTLLERSGAKISLENRAFPQRGAIVRARWKREEFERQRTWQKHIDAAEEDYSVEKVAAPPLAEDG
jgi:two-component system, sensor histidine kinase RegB